MAISCAAIALSCAKESTESIPYSDVPVSFSAFGSWDEATKTAADGSRTIFTAGDRIGVFAYHNDSASPDFMNGPAGAVRRHLLELLPDKILARCPGRLAVVLRLLAVQREAEICHLSRYRK